MMRLWSAPAPAVFPLPSRPPSAGSDVVVFDENARPGGQLFKQIHKFFGSKGASRQGSQFSHWR